MRRFSAVPVLGSLLIGGLALVVGSPAQAQGIAHYRHLDAQVFGSVAIGMPNPRTISIQHLDTATGQWDAPTTLARTRGRVTCGEIAGRASAGGFAVLAECDAPYYDDQAPARSLALVSRDGRSWAKTTLPGEAYHAPAVSPDGAYAAWLAGETGEFVEWSAAGGFAATAATTYSYNGAADPTIVVDDAGTVSVLGAEERGDACVVGVHTRDLAGTQTHFVVEGIDPGCTEGALENVDALTVTGGTERADRFTLARTSVGAPWTVTRLRPSDAPGLVRYGYSRKRIATAYVDTVHADRPLVAIGSPDRRRILAQVYDEATQTWGPQTELYTAGRQCSDGGGYYSEEPRELYIYDLDCGQRITVLASLDGRSWTVGRVGRRPWTYVGGQLALPEAGGTTVVSSRGVQRFPGTAVGDCGFVWPGRPGELVRLYGPPGAAWPDRIQVSTGGRFHTVSRARRIDLRCKRVYADTTVDPPVMLLRPTGDKSDRVAQLRLRRGEWRLVYGPAVY